MELIDFLRHVALIQSTKCIGEGRNRIVYVSECGNYVFKVPINKDGEFNNWCEHVRFNEYKEKWYPLARCHGIPESFILIMEYVDADYILHVPVNERPDWVGFVDCAQVGYNKAGELVAYDYGN